MTANYTTLITLHHNYNSTTLQLQLQLQYITLHPAVVGEVTTATIATIPANHNSNHLSVNQWLRSAIPDSQQPNSPIGFLFLKLPPPPCAVLLVIDSHLLHSLPWPILRASCITLEGAWNDLNANESRAIVSAPHGICRTPFRVVLGHSISSSDFIRNALNLGWVAVWRSEWLGTFKDIYQEVPERLRAWGESCFEGVWRLVSPVHSILGPWQETGRQVE